MRALVAVLVVVATVAACKKRMKEAPPSATAVAIDAAVDAAPPPTLAQVLPAYLAVTEVYARILEAIEDDYPGVPADRSAKATWTARMPVFKFYIEPWTSIEKIKTMARTRGEPLDRQVVAFLDHLQQGWPRIVDLQLYIKREDYLDDRWDKLAAADAALRPIAMASSAWRAMARGRRSRTAAWA